METIQKVVYLRELLAHKFPPVSRPRAGYWPTKIPRLDAVLGGGLSKGAITEIITHSGGGLLIDHLFRTAIEQRALVSFIDGRDTLDVDSIDTALLSRLLWVRCRTAAEAMRSTDLVLRDGNFPLIILDLRANSLEEFRRIAATTWYRFQRVAESTAAAFVVLTQHAVAASAHQSLSLDAHFSIGAMQSRREALLCELKTQTSHKDQQVQSQPHVRRLYNPHHHSSRQEHQKQKTGGVPCLA